jgi:hypothetical protein
MISIAPSQYGMMKEEQHREGASECHFPYREDIEPIRIKQIRPAFLEPGYTLPRLPRKPANSGKYCWGIRDRKSYNDFWIAGAPRTFNP